MGYFWMSVAVVLGAVGHAFNKLLAGEIRLVWGIGFLLCYGFGFLAMREGLKTMPFGVAIPGFAAGMVVVSALVGWWYFGERMTLVQAVAYGVMLVGIGLLITANLRGM